MSEHQNAPNVLEIIPSPNAEFVEENDRIIIVLPKRRNRLVAGLFPNAEPRRFKLHLDEFGTFVWRRMDGCKRVFDIAQELHGRFGARVEPVYERLGLFINMLAQRRLITLQQSQRASVQR